MLSRLILLMVPMVSWAEDPGEYLAPQANVKLHFTITKINICNIIIQERAKAGFRKRGRQCMRIQSSGVLDSIWQ